MDWTLKMEKQSSFHSITCNASTEKEHALKHK